jgi:hypothetical protein
MANRNWYLSTSALTGIFALGLGTAVSAADLGSIAPAPGAPPADDLPAVSGINGKVSGFGGWENYDLGADGGLFGVDGSFSIPLGQMFGFQADGMISSLDGNFIGGAAGHLFWRNPATGLLGLYGSWVTRDGSGVDTWRIGVEGEFYSGPITIQGVVGYEGADVPAFILLDDEDVFAYADLAYYATPDLRFSAGYRRLNGLDMAALGAEWQLPADFIGGTSLFAEGRIGEDDYASVWAGLRVYLGAERKTLIRRHREDDPFNWLSNNIFDFDSCAIEPDFAADGFIEDSISEECFPFRGQIAE